MPTSKLQEVYSMLAEWETQAKELAQNEFLSEANAKLEERAKQLFEGIAFDQLGEEDELEEGELPSLLSMYNDGESSRDLRAARQNAAGDSRREASAQTFNPKSRVPAEKAAYGDKMKSDARFQVGAASSASVGKQHLPEEEQEENEELPVDTTAGETVSPLDTELSLATGEAPVDEPLPTDTSVDASAEFGWDDPAVSVAKDGNDDTVITIDAASLGAGATDPDTAPAAAGECTCPIHGNGNTSTAGVEGGESTPENNSDNEVIDMTQEPDMDAILESFIALSENADENQVEIVSEAEAKSFEKLEGTKPMTKAGEAINEGEMEELTEEELAALDESMDTDAMMKALQEAFIGGTGFVNESDDDDDDDEWDEDQAEAVKNVKKGRKLPVGDLDESRDDAAFLQNKAGVQRRASAEWSKSGGSATADHLKNMSRNSSEDARDTKNKSMNLGEGEELEEEAGAKSFEKLEGTKPMKTVGKKGLEEDEDIDGEELEEASQRTLGQGRKQTLKPNTFPKERMRPGMNESQKLMTKLSEKVNAVLAENARLKSENKEMATLNEGLETKFTAAAEKLQEVKGKLYEASIIASKSTCMNKLMLEHVTTQDEKINIVESFQKASSRAEVQNLFEKFDKSFKKGGSAQLNEGKNPLSKLNPLFKSETNTQEVLNEGTVYDNAFTAKMDRLIGYGGKK
jgi:hypothetical protein